MNEILWTEFKQDSNLKTFLNMQYFINKTWFAFFTVPTTVFCDEIFMKYFSWNLNKTCRDLNIFLNLTKNKINEGSDDSIKFCVESS